MNIAVNGSLRAVEAPVPLIDLLAEIVGPEPPPGIAVAVNGEVVRRPCWKDVQIADGDSIEIVKAAQGG